ncbi:hypothetical protein CICLE_v10009145mg [Citrus x clementina]|uniref:Uncharacterized protein n=1 Tax=Citrus clementina TaxID=85681 RepID=V4UFR2_CITCL|nr:uncharacterized protein LOC18053682 isoform X2 [Citrus x clementina]ESR64927.1 hypothetical protein CICLE_v10009145mg [Citrus x clementina]
MLILWTSELTGSRFYFTASKLSLCLGGGYIVFTLGLARLSSNDEINEDARKILDLYVAGEDENPDIPLPDGIPKDLGAKEPISNPRSPPYGSKELYILRKVNKKKAQLREKIPIERQSSKASEVSKKRSMEKCDVPIWGASSGRRKTMANPTQKTYSEKSENVGPQKEKYSDPLKGVQNEGLSKVLLPTDSDESESDGVVTKEDHKIGCKEILSKSCSTKEAFSGDREDNNAHVERNQKWRNDAAFSSGTSPLRMLSAESRAWLWKK